MGREYYYPIPITNDGPSNGREAPTFGYMGHLDAMRQNRQGRTKMVKMHGLGQHGAGYGLPDT